MEYNRPILSKSTKGITESGNPFSGDSRSTPLTSSVLGKRLNPYDGPSSSRKALHGSTTGQVQSTTTLLNRIRELEAENAMETRMVEQLNEDNRKLRDERKVLYDGEKNERQTGESREIEWGEERTKLARQVTELRSSRQKIEDSFAQLQNEHTRLKLAHSSIIDTTDTERLTFTSRIRELEKQVADTKHWRGRADSLSIQLEETKRMNEEKGRDREDKKDDRRTEDVVRLELKRQAQHLVHLERNHAAMQTEVLDLRQKRKDADAAERAQRDIERALRDEIRELHDQLERSRRDMDSLTQTFPSSSPSSADSKTLQSRLSTLSTLLTQANADLAKKESENLELHERLRKLSVDHTALLVDSNKQLREAGMKLRWAEQGRASSEKIEAVLRDEIKALRSSGGNAGDSESGDQSTRIRQLEEINDRYKAALDDLARDSRDVEDRLTEGAGLVKQTSLQEAQDKISQLEADIQCLESTISQLTSANTTLDAEVNDLMRRVASGEYNPVTQRCIELRNNPAAKIQSIRAGQLDDLKKENEALLERLKAGDASGKQSDVPMESFLRLTKEKEESDAAHAKRLQRLKEIFSAKSREFLEAVNSLLGWRIRFDDGGGDIRMTSMYAPKGKMGLTLRFASEAGHYGTMQVTGGMARSFEESKHFWVTERQSVPGFLAQITTEMFERTTIGRAAGYVGLE